MLLLLALAGVEELQARDWYSSPSAAATGSGSVTNPWPLMAALTNTTQIIPGDTLYLRGGSYRGPFTSTLAGTSNSYITVRSYPGEWAVITDGQVWTLDTNLTSATSEVYNVRLLGSESFPKSEVWIKLGSEISYAHNKSSSNLWQLIRTHNITSHSAGEIVTLEGDFISHSGSYTRFMDFEVTATAQTNRQVDTSQGYGNRSGLKLSASGTGNKAINLIIHNVGHPAIGFWQQGAGGEINGCLFWGNGLYDYNTIRGAAIYAQNDLGMATVKNIITFRNLTRGAKIYGVNGPTRNFQYLTNISFANPASQLEANSSIYANSNIWFSGNQILGTFSLYYEATGHSHQYVVGNTIVNGGLLVKEQKNSVYTNNTIFNMTNVNVSQSTAAENGYRVVGLSSNEMNINWDYNTWYIGNDSTRNAWRFNNADTNATWVYFNQWQAVSGFDAHSTVATNWPTDYLKVTVMPNDYDANRWHICVINMTSATNATLDLSTLGFTGGQRYELRDAQNYFTVIDSGSYTNSSISLPLNLTNVSPIPGITHYTNKHTNVDQPGLFNAFVLRRTLPLAPPTALRLSN